MSKWQFIKLLLFGTSWGRCTQLGKNLSVSHSIKYRNKWYSVSVKSVDREWDAKHI